MGCDIHLHIEVKIKDQWHHYGCPNIQRNYKLFAKMAGVRTSQPLVDEILPPQGIPEDITLITKLDFQEWRYDCHHVSWFGLAEICKLEDWCKEMGGQKEGYDLEWDILNSFLFDSSFTGFYRYPCDDDPNDELKIQDVRFVFWFDN